MKKLLLSFLIVSAGLLAFAQEDENNPNQYTNSADNLLIQDSKLLIGGYGEVHYNQPLSGDTYNNGKLDVHRVVMLLGYNFNEKTQFITEIEYEHVKEVYVEQAFLQYKLNNAINFRGGLMLVPMGIINEYHEPTTFNGVERPLVDNTITPTTWREIGFGVTGTMLPASLKYQAYVMNGFNGYDGSAKLSGAKGMRSGRQKGAESYVSAPNFAGKIEYFGIRGLNLGLSTYLGKTQSKLYNGIDKDDDAAVAMADSSVVGISMFGLDARYSVKGLQLRGQLYYAGLSNTDEYNTFTAKDGSLNDVGSAMIGYYAEAAYNVFRTVDTELQLTPFVRYEFLNTHSSVENTIAKNAAYEKTAITTGLTLALTKGAVVKTDIQFVKNAATNTYAKTFSAGIGVMF
ncbi:hypothetical protein SAMN05444285_12730 [Draconibacterium orientale]|uniref:Phosphate-selective porin O and P n=1 Tax=Draconibacterium orientale TaxID=1168034 RepID=X5DC48_9BACT|nr:hypothetical protein [Draconibacterium orientale]AHW58534.1 hypothetical protein FH5T_00345 [Draconibacterium orientale]SET88875.1 hypothetical protein SAMN05444285_12730 [Draconibacterium orientale]